jgi:diacylglycerol kinase family enzyme
MEKDCLFCFCGNSRWYGGGFMAAPLALPDDGLLDIVLVEANMSRLKLLTLLNKYKRGEHLDWDITTFKRGKKINIKSSKPAAVNVDGECQYVTESTFEIIEKGVKFVVPACSDFMERVKNNNV